MRRYKVLLLILVSVGQDACMMAPVRSTYYEPIATAGTPERFVRAHERKDTLGREVDGLDMRVHAEFRPNKPLIVGVSVIHCSGAVEVDANLIEVHGLAAGSVVHSESVKSQDRATRYDARQWIEMCAPKFDELAAPNDIAVVFTRGSVKKRMERIAKEGRKYGVGLAVVSQRPHEVSETVLAQCETFICLRISNPDDQAYVRS